MKRLVDPSVAELIKLPKDDEQAAHQLFHHWVPAFDNMSRLPEWLSDAFCRAVTGEGASKRKLYTDDEEHIRAYRRCLVLNGINSPVLRADLLDRSVLVELSPPDEIAPESILNDQWKEAAPVILGGFFDAVSGAMDRVDDMEAPTDFRMADFARWGQALAAELGYDPAVFLSWYAEAADHKFVDAVEGDDLAKHLIQYVQDQDGEWGGTATDLLSGLTPPSVAIQKKRPDWLPENARGLSQKLRRLQPALERAGVKITWPGRESDTRRKLIRIVVEDAPE